MTTKAHDTDTSAKKGQSANLLQTAEKDAKPFQDFFTKFNNDWSMNLSAALAYNLLMALFPIGLAIFGIFGLFVSADTLQHWITQNVLGGLADHLKNTPQGTNPLDTFIAPIVKQYKSSSGFFAIIAIILALFNGSRLFILMEGCFGIIYHVRQRKFLQQNLMAFGMLLLFIILIPLMVFAAAAPPYIINLFHFNGFLAVLGGLLGGILAAFIFFVAIYVVVPNQKISIRDSWMGALVAAIALELYINLFSFYATHFLGQLAQLGSAVIVLVFFYYFAVILFLGAEVNAFFAEGVKATPTDLVSMVHIVTSHLPKTEEEKQRQAAESHKDAPTGSTAAKTGIDAAVTTTRNAETNQKVSDMKSINDELKIQGGTEQGQSTAAKTGDTKKEQQPAKARTVVVEHPAKIDRPKSASKVATVLEAVAGTALAFVVELFIRRKRKYQ